jgi:hypothetical protein
VVDKLWRLGATGGAYIGAGPEQNFAYIAKIRPRIPLAAIKKAIQEGFQFTLSETDQESLEYVYKSFRADGLGIGFRLIRWFGGGSGGSGLAHYIGAEKSER